MLSTTLPVLWAVAPHELLPIIPPSRAVGVRRGLRPVAQSVDAQLAVQLVQHDPRLDDAGPRVRINGNQPVTVLRPVEHHGGVGALPGEAGAAAPGQHGHVVAAADGDCGHGRVHVARHDHANRHLPEVGRISGIGRARADVEAHLSVDPVTQRPL